MRDAWSPFQTVRESRFDSVARPHSTPKKNSGRDLRYSETKEN